MKLLILLFISLLSFLRSDTVLEKTDSNRYCTIFNIKVNSSNENSTVFTSCFRENEHLILWVKHNLEIIDIQNEKCENPLTFTEVPELFQGLPLNSMYLLRNQRVGFQKVLGTDRHTSSYNFVNRGHLAPKSDFALCSKKLATCHFLNVNPQWKEFNAGNWNNLEMALRSYVMRHRIQVDVYTGTFGILKLPDTSNKYQDMYLDPDRQIPVPAWYFKIVYQPSTKLGYAFVGLNNPHLTKSEAIKAGYSLCTNLCEGSLDWVSFDNNNMERGYTVCCDVNDLKKYVPSLPHLEIKGRLF